MLYDSLCFLEYLRVTGLAAFFGDRCIVTGSDVSFGDRDSAVFFGDRGISALRFLRVIESFQRFCLNLRMRFVCLTENYFLTLMVFIVSNI